MRAAKLDEKLILRLAAGDAAAFRELYEQTSGSVFGFALSILKNRQDAEDVMQETYIKTVNSAPSYQGGGKPLAWMLTIVRNLCYNRLRDGKTCEDLSMFEVPAQGADAIGQILDRQLLESAFRVLEPEERQIVILHAVTGWKHKEIASFLELSIGTVLSKYHRALKKLRNEIEKDGGNAK